MKIIFAQLFFLLSLLSAFGQKGGFVGIAKYKMSVVGGDDKNADSMSVIFDKNRTLVTLYITSSGNPGKINELCIINDFTTNKQYILNKTSKTYKIDTLINIGDYDFIDSKKIMLINGGICFHYKADSSQIDKSKMLRSDCLASIDYISKDIKDYWFMGVQPIIVDNRIVMDFIVTEPDGSRPRIFISNIAALKKVDKYFDISDYKEGK